MPRDYSGLFLSLYAISTVILLKGRKRVKLNTPMLAVSFAMLVFATIHVGSDLQRVLDGFLNPERPPSVYLPNVNDPLYLLKSTAYTAQTLLGDGFLLYRVYLVWQGNRFITGPLFLCFLSSTAVGIGTLHAFTQVTPTTAVFIVDLQHWILAFFVLTLTTNFTCTCLIAGRIWWVHRTTQGRVGGPNLAAPMILVIESGAIYSICLIILIILYASGSFAQYIALDAVSQVVGIVFSLVIVRIGLGLTPDGQYNARGPTPTPISFLNINSRNDTALTQTQDTPAPAPPPDVKQDKPPQSWKLRVPNLMPKKKQQDTEPRFSMQTTPPQSLSVQATPARSSENLIPTGMYIPHTNRPLSGQSYQDVYSPYKAFGESPRTGKSGESSV